MDTEKSSGLKGSLDFARDFACGLKRPQKGSTSTRPHSCRRSDLVRMTGVNILFGYKFVVVKLALRFAVFSFALRFAPRAWPSAERIWIFERLSGMSKLMP